MSPPAKTDEAIEAAVFRRLLRHLDDNKNVQNIDLMQLAGFCRNCLAKWYAAAAEEQGVPVYVLRRNTPGQIVGFLEQMSGEADDDGAHRHHGALEAEEGVQRILSGEASVIELRPQSSFVRRVQHRIAEQAQLRSHSVGQGPRRRVTIRRT